MSKKKIKIDVINTAQEVIIERVQGKTVVVIDVLRATSVMVTAIYNNVRQIIPVLSPEEAFETKSRLGHNVILGGERHAEPIEGFDYGNSPLSYTNEKVEDKTLVMTTSNGTLAIHNALMAKHLIIGSFLNAQAVADVSKVDEDIVFVCSGTNGNYTVEDNLCAGYIINLIQSRNPELHLTDSAMASLYLYKSTGDDIVALASQGHHYNILKEKHYLNDLKECFTLNKYDIVPVWNGESIIKAV